MALHVHSENKSFFSNDLLSLAFIKLSNMSDHFGPPCITLLNFVDTNKTCQTFSFKTLVTIENPKFGNISYMTRLNKEHSASYVQLY